MSKSFKALFLPKSQFSFLQTVQSNSLPNSIKIVIEDAFIKQQAKDSKRYVCVYTPHQEIKKYCIDLDQSSGYGEIVLAENSAGMYRVVYCDHNKKELKNVTYYVDDLIQQQAPSINVMSDKHQQVIKLVINEHSKANVLIQKQLMDQYGNPQPFDAQHEFVVEVSNSDGYQQSVYLNQSNHFESVLNNLGSGTYHFQECGANGYEIKYRHNLGEAVEQGIFELVEGDNSVRVINTVCADTQIKIELFERTCQGDLICNCIEPGVQCILRRCDEEQIIDLDCENNYGVNLYGKLAGQYEIAMLKPCADYIYSFVINEQSYQACAPFTLAENGCVEICIIQTLLEQCNVDYQQGCPLRICKLIKDKNGSLNKACSNEVYQVRIHGCGVDETYNLNANNNFCVDLASLCSGNYEVEEISNCAYISSYQINQGCEKTSACFYYNGCDPICVNVINELRNTETIWISKLIRNANNELVKPSSDMQFNVVLSSYFVKECFCLNAENDFCMCFNSVRYGGYEIREEAICDYQTSYKINGEKETNRARFIVDGCSDIEVKIINTPQLYFNGLLQIEKWEETTGGQYVKPAANECFDVRVSGDYFDEVYSLNANNAWCIELEGLQSSVYYVEELNNSEYETRYLVNNVPCEKACVKMSEANQTIAIINRPINNGLLKLDLAILNSEQQYVKPSVNMRFDIVVEGNNQVVNVCLDNTNQWCVEIDNLPLGNYRIIQKDTLGFIVSYDVNGERCTFAKVNMCKNDNQVRIINEMMQFSGNVYINKQIINANQFTQAPNCNDSYTFQISGRCIDELYTLDQSNNFQVCLSDLDEGTYEICELNTKDVQYLVNGVCCKSGKFQLKNEDVYIDIVNHQTKSGLLTIEKRLLIGNKVVIPPLDACYMIVVKGKHFHEMYELNSENEFTICLNNLTHQKYEIKESSSCHKQYQLNGEYVNNSLVDYDGNDLHFRIINEEDSYACMEIIKKIEDENGDLITPSRYESFEIVVESNSYKECFALNKDNNFRVQLWDLKPDHYEVYENCEGYNVSYLINEMPCEKACVDINQEDILITVINTVQNCGSITLNGYIEENGCIREAYCDEIIELKLSAYSLEQPTTLNEANRFSETICDLVSETYNLCGNGCDELSFEIDSQGYQDNVNIVLNGEDVCVKVVKKAKFYGEITIERILEDQNGDCYYPSCDSFEQIILTSNNQKTCVQLDETNNFKQKLTKMEYGPYQLHIENSKEKVQFQVDQQARTNSGNFELNCESVNIAVLSNFELTYNVEFEAFEQKCHKPLMIINQDIDIIIELVGSTETVKVALNKANNYWASIPLKPDNYTIKSDPKLRLSFASNEVDLTCPQFELCTDIKIQVVNEVECDEGAITVSKMINDYSCNCLKLPKNDETFEFQLSGEKCCEVYTLSKNNEWTQRIENLKIGEYTISELGCERVLYSIDDQEAKASACFKVEQVDHTITIINEDITCLNGSIEICKLMKDECGNYCYPHECDQYSIMIEGECFKETVTLDISNNFHCCLRHLRDGCYQISELNNNTVCYVVNNAQCTNLGYVNVRQNANTVNVINEMHNNQGSMHICKLLQQSDGTLIVPNNGLEYVLHISKANYNRTVSLNQSNSYCVSINNLENGTYVIDEIDHDNVSYIINGGSQVNYGVVEVVNNANTVQVINQVLTSNGMIVLDKYIRSEQELVKPTMNQVYQFLLTGNGLVKTLTLNSANNWMEQVNDLVKGMYTIKEINNSNKVSYIINGNTESSEAVIEVSGNEVNVKAINQLNSEAASLTITKFFKDNNGNVVAPSQDFTTRVHISKPSFQKMITLNALNQWTITIQDIEDGDYVIDELDGNHVTYRVNGGSEVNFAIVRIEGNMNTVDIYNAFEMSGGSILIEKFMRDEFEDLIIPPEQFSIDIRVSKPDYNAVFTLNAANSFKVRLDNLAPGLYVIDELAASEQVTYIINGGSEVSNAIVEVDHNFNEVIIVNTQVIKSNSIQIEKYIRNGNNNLQLPNNAQSYVVEISGPNMVQQQTLSFANGWNVILSDLVSGEYRVKEITNDPLKVTYIVDEQAAQSIAVFILENSSVKVKVINALDISTQSLTIDKKIKNSDGSLIRPADGDVFFVQLISRNDRRSIRLDNGNNFMYRLSDLQQEIYQVIEQDLAQLYVTTYQVNDAKISSEAFVDMRLMSNQRVQIFNELMGNGNTIEVFKYMLDNSGNYLPPSGSETYRFLISSDTIERFYDLTIDNDWHVSISTLPSGTYQIQEVNSNYQVKYLVNSANLLEEAIFTTFAGSTSIIGIINMLDRENASIAISKKLINNQDEISDPNSNEVFNVRISSSNYNEVFVLDQSNNFRAITNNLTFGSYLIEESDGNYPISFEIDGVVSASGIVEVSTNKRTEVTIYNKVNNNITTSSNNQVKVVLE